MISSADVERQESGTVYSNIQDARDYALWIYGFISRVTRAPGGASLCNGETKRVIHFAHEVLRVHTVSDAASIY